MQDKSPAETFDCILVGGGLVGQTLAIALAAHDLSVAVIERADPDAHMAPAFDGRASAIASSTARMLRALGFGDLLDVEGTRAETGKGVKKDSAAGKATLISVLGVERAREQSKTLAQQAIDHLGAFDGRADTLRALARYVISRKS